MLLHLFPKTTHKETCSSITTLSCGKSATPTPQDCLCQEYKKCNYHRWLFWGEQRALHADQTLCAGKSAASLGLRSEALLLGSSQVCHGPLVTGQQQWGHGEKPKGYQKGLQSIEAATWRSGAQVVSSLIPSAGGKDAERSGKTHLINT